MFLYLDLLKIIKTQHNFKVIESTLNDKSLPILVASKTVYNLSQSSNNNNIRVLNIDKVNENSSDIEDIEFNDVENLNQQALEKINKVEIKDKIESKKINSTLTLISTKNKKHSNTETELSKLNKKLIIGQTPAETSSIYEQQQISYKLIHLSEQAQILKTEEQTYTKNDIIEDNNNNLKENSVFVKEVENKSLTDNQILNYNINQTGEKLSQNLQKVFIIKLIFLFFFILAFYATNYCFKCIFCKQ